MSGHSKWAQIKHKKAGTDAKRGALFSKLIRLITVAAKEGGSDLAANFKLRQTLAQARSAGLPKENIERAIARSSSASGDSPDLKRVEYEAYGPGGSGYLISGLTDNSNRTTAEIKHLLEKFGGRLAASGSVAWMFDRRILIELPIPPANAEETELALIDAGAENTNADQESSRLQAVVNPEEFEVFQEKIKELGLTMVESAFAAIPKNTIELDPAAQNKAAALIEALEDHPDINDVWTNIANLQ